MTDIRINLHKAKFTRKLKSYLKKRLRIIALDLDKLVKQSLRISNAHGSNPSSPGQIPHLGTGHLRASIRNRVYSEYGLVAEVYVDEKSRTHVNYGKYLEYGTNRMQARPFLHPVLEKYKHRIIQILKV